MTPFSTALQNPIGVLSYGQYYTLNSCTVCMSNIYSKNSPAVKKYAAPKKAIMKKDVKSKVAACDGKLIAKILLTTNNSGEFVLGFDTKFT